jgi:hypothetical protein
MSTLTKDLKTAGNPDPKAVIVSPPKPDLEKQTFDAHFDSDYSELTACHSEKPSGKEIAFGIVMFVLWVVFFGAGCFVPTESFRTVLLSTSTGIFTPTWIGSCLLVVFCYTITNILFLTLFSSFIGCLACRWRVSDKSDGMLHFYAKLPPQRIFLAAGLRAFFLYLAIISGLLIFSTESAVMSTGFAQYIRIAGFCSVFGFMIGYDPTLIYKFMGKVSDLANKPIAPVK